MPSGISRIMAGPISEENLARGFIKTLMYINSWVGYATVGALAAYGLYCICKDDDDTDAADETPEREQSIPAPPSSG
jgi:hypothetical protein